MSRNRLHNARNEYQGSDVRVLTVCSAGLLRSPTLARLLHRRFKNVNCRPVGLNNEYALVPLEDVHLLWADAVLVMESWMFHELEERMSRSGYERELHCLNVPDNFSFGAPELETILNGKLDQLLETLRAEDYDAESDLKELEEL